MGFEASILTSAFFFLCSILKLHISQVFYVACDNMQLQNQKSIEFSQSENSIDFSILKLHVSQVFYVACDNMQLQNQKSIEFSQRVLIFLLVFQAHVDTSRLKRAKT